MKKFEEKYLKIKHEIFKIDLKEKKKYYETKSKWFSHSDI